MKRDPASCAPTAASTRAKKYCFSTSGSSVLPDLLDTMNSVRAGSILLSMVRICAGSVELRTRSSGLPGCRPKVSARTSGPRLDPPMPRRTMWEKFCCRISAARLESAPMRSRSCATMPSQPEPFRLVGAAPQRRVARPQPPHVSALPPRFEAVCDRLLVLGRKLGALTVEPVAEDGGTLAGDRAEQLVERVRKELDALLDQLRGDRIERNPGAPQRCHHLLGPIEIFLEARSRFAMIPEGVHGGGRHGIDGVGCRSARRRRARRCSSGSWCRCSPTTAAGPARPWHAASPSARRRRAACTLDRRAWHWRSATLPWMAASAARSSPAPPWRRRSSMSLSTAMSMRLTKKLATLAIPGSPPCATSSSRPRQIRLDHLFIDLLREQQRDVDVDAVGDELANRRQPGAGRRNLDHDIVARDLAPQPPRLGDRRLRAHRQIGRHLEAHIAVRALGLRHRPGAEYRRRFGCPRSPAARRASSLEIALAQDFFSDNRIRRCRRSPSRRSRDWR